jgi:hypothetical protein
MSGALICGPVDAQSYGYDNLTIDFVGVVEWEPKGFVAFVGGIPFGGSGQVPNGCINGIAYYDPARTEAKFWYMTFLTAKVTDLRVFVEITQDSFRNCWIVGARIKD